VHVVVALALPAVEAFDLAIPAQVFADPGLPRRYELPSVRLRLGWCGRPRDFRSGLSARDAGTTPTSYRAAYQGRAPAACEARS
jgi:hypothetical protein